MHVSILQLHCKVKTTPHVNKRAIRFIAQGGFNTLPVTC